MLCRYSGCRRRRVVLQNDGRPSPTPIPVAIQSTRRRHGSLRRCRDAWLRSGAKRDKVFRRSGRGRALPGGWTLHWAVPASYRGGQASRRHCEGIFLAKFVLFALSRAEAGFTVEIFAAIGEVSGAGISFNVSDGDFRSDEFGRL